MCSVAMASFYPHMVSRLVSLSAGSNAHPRAIAYRYLQRRCIMEDPLWNRGHYYEGEYPLKGTKLARLVIDVIKCGACCEISVGVIFAGHMDKYKELTIKISYLDQENG